MITFRGRLFAAAVTAAVTVTGAAWAQETVVKMTSARTFEPRVVEVKVGETVVWRNDSMAVHTVTADPTRAKNPDAIALPAGVAPVSPQPGRPASTDRHPFPTPGTYRYIDIHAEDAGLMGEVVVR